MPDSVVGDLSSKVVLVTGASSGIGESIALELGAQRACVGVNYHSEADSAQSVAQRIRQSGGKADVIQANVAVAADVQRMVEETVQRFGRLDVLVNNAGIEHGAPFLEKSEEDWDRTLAVNLKGPFLCAQAAARHMAKNGGKGGTIINISSVHEEQPFPGYADYCAAKGGLRMLCRDLAVELAPYNINVVNVGPGAIATPINETKLTDPEQKAALVNAIPLHRIGDPGEIAKLVAFLASDSARYITGTTIFADGGLMLQVGAL